MIYSSQVNSRCLSKRAQTARLRIGLPKYSRSKLKRETDDRPTNTANARRVAHLTIITF